MHCRSFLDRYSDYHDGLMPEEVAADFERHLDECSDCRRYRNVLSVSTGVLRGLPRLEAGDSFRHLLVHRLSVNQEIERLWIGSRGSAVTTGAVLALAILLTALAWSPMLGPEPVEITLDPIVVTTPSVRATPLGTFSSSLLVGIPAGAGEMELWLSPSELFYQYSAFSQRGRPAPQPAFVRTGLGLQ